MYMKCVQDESQMPSGSTTEQSVPKGKVQKPSRFKQWRCLKYDSSMQPPHNKEFQARWLWPSNIFFALRILPISPGTHVSGKICSTLRWLEPLVYASWPKNSLINTLSLVFNHNTREGQERMWVKSTYTKGAFSVSMHRSTHSLGQPILMHNPVGLHTFRCPAFVEY